MSFETRCNCCHDDPCTCEDSSPPLFETSKTKIQRRTKPSRQQELFIIEYVSDGEPFSVDPDFSFSIFTTQAEAGEAIRDCTEPDAKTELQLVRFVRQAEIEALKADLAQVKNALMISEEYRRAYQVGKYKLFAISEEIRNAASEHLPSGSEGPMERYTKKIEAEHSPLLVDHNRRLLMLLKEAEAELTKERARLDKLMEKG